LPFIQSGRSSLRPTEALATAEDRPDNARELVRNGDDHDAFRAARQQGIDPRCFLWSAASVTHQARRAEPPADARGLTPLVWGHVSPYGAFDLDMEQRLDLDPVVEA
jgi:hypothetical protein